MKFVYNIMVGSTEMWLIFPMKYLQSYTEQSAGESGTS